MSTLRDQNVKLIEFKKETRYGIIYKSEIHFMLACVYFFPEFQVTL